MTVGIDVSGWDPVINWSQYELDFVFVKCSEGIVRDRNFVMQWAAARGQTPRGPYHFFRPRVDAKEAAKQFVSYLGRDFGELPPVLDLEVTDSVEGTAILALEWLNEVEKLTGIEPIVYTSPSFINHTGITFISAYSKYRLWLATYPWDKVSERWTEEQRANKVYNILKGIETYTFPPTPRPFRSVTFVQWTATASPEHISGYPLGGKKEVDVNFYNGSIKELYEEFSIKITQGEPMSQVVTLTAELATGQPSNLRSSPGLSGGIIQLLNGPLSIQGVGPKILKDNYYWIEIIYPTHGFVALTTSYTNVVYNSAGLPVTPAPAPTPTTRKIVRAVLYYDDGQTEELVPKT